MASTAPTAANPTGNGAQPGLGRRQILLVIGALMLGMLLAATAAGVFRASISFWAGTGGTVPLERLIDQAFAALADGLPERCELRNITGKDNT